ARLATTQVGPYHTNTAEGLRLARRILQAQGKEMKQIVMVTDGKPTACFVEGTTIGAGGSLSSRSAAKRGAAASPDQRRLYKNSMGGDPFVMDATFKEVQACRKAGIMINTFMLASDYYLIEFVKQMTAMTSGKAYFANPNNLSQFVLIDFPRRAFLPHFILLVGLLITFLACYYVTKTNDAKDQARFKASVQEITTFV